MAAPLSSLIRPRRGPMLAALERLAPAPAEDLIAAEIEAGSRAGDVILELHGRGGWVARSAIDRLRRVYSLEATALTALVAEVVLRPPDLRHLDAAITNLANAPRGTVGLRESIAQGFASTCPDCFGPVRVEEFIWDMDADVPARRAFRCSHCRGSRGDGRPVPAADEDRARARSFATTAGRDGLRARFPVPDPTHPLLGDLLGLFTPRMADGLAAIIERIESDLRAPSIQAALRLAVVHLALPATRLNGYPGRLGALRVVHGRVKAPGGRQFRERDPWLLFEEGARAVRTFVQRLDGGATGHHAARYGRDIAALLDGSANVVLRQGAWTDPTAGLRLSGGPRTGGDDRVTLVLSQPPIHWTPETLGLAYVATALGLGYDAAATLPLEALFGPPQRGEWAWDAAALRRSLGGARQLLAADGRAIVLLDRTGPGGLVAGVLGGIGAGYRLRDALLTESGDEITGTLEFSQPGAAMADGQARAFPELPGVDPTAPFSLRACERATTEIAVAILQARGEPTRAERLLGEVLIGLDRMGHLARLVGTPAEQGGHAPSGTGAGQRPVATGLFGEMPAAGPDASAPQRAVPFETTTTATRTGTASWRDPSRNIRDAGSPDLPGSAAVRPLTADRAPGADPRIALRRSRPSSPSDEGTGTGAVGVRGPVTGTPVGGTPVPVGGTGAGGSGAVPGTGMVRTPAAAMAASERVLAWGAEDSSADPVKLILDIVMGELRRPDHPRLEEVEPGRWWLRDAADAAAARAPLSDRVEWAVYSLLSTSGGISEAAFFDRIAAMFRGYDTPDEELVRACLDSYRLGDAPPDALLTTADPLQGRFEEHGGMVGRIAEFGQRLGLRTWISRREQRRSYRGRPLADLLSEAEQRVYLPLIHPGPSEALEGVDCVWYLRGKATFLWEVEWTAMLDESVIRRGARIPTTESLYRFLVIPPERTELVRLKLARSPVLRRHLDEDNWHVIKSDHLDRLLRREDAGLGDLEPLLGLDPAVERQGEQLALFG